MFLEDRMTTAQPIEFDHVEVGMDLHVTLVQTGYRVTESTYRGVVSHITEDDDWSVRNFTLTLDDSCTHTFPREAYGDTGLLIYIKEVVY